MPTVSWRVNRSVKMTDPNLVRMYVCTCGCMSRKSIDADDYAGIWPDVIRLPTGHWAKPAGPPYMKLV